MELSLQVTHHRLNGSSSPVLKATKIGQILAVLGVRGFKKLRFLLQKARPCVNPRRLSHFTSKSVEGCDLQVGWEKSKKLTETPIGKTCRR